MSLTTLSDTGIPVKAGISSIGPEPSGPDGSWHAFKDEIPIGVSSREWTGSGYRFSGRAGQRLPVEIGGVPTRMVDVPGAEDYGGYQLVDIPVTVRSGQHAITVDGTTVATVQIYNPDYPSDPKPETSESAPTPDPDDGSSNGSSGSGDGNSDPLSTPSNSPTPDPDESTDSGSSGGGSSIDSRTRAAVIAVMGVVAALIATR